MKCSSLARIFGISLFFTCIFVNEVQAADLSGPIYELRDSHGNLRGFAQNMTLQEWSAQARTAFADALRPGTVAVVYHNPGNESWKTSGLLEHVQNHVTFSGVDRVALYVCNRDGNPYTASEWSRLTNRPVITVNGRFVSHTFDLHGSPRTFLIPDQYPETLGARIVNWEKLTTNVRNPKLNLTAGEKLKNKEKVNIENLTNQEMRHKVFNTRDPQPFSDPFACI